MVFHVASEVRFMYNCEEKCKEKAEGWQGNTMQVIDGKVKCSDVLPMKG